MSRSTKTGAPLLPMTEKLDLDRKTTRQDLRPVNSQSSAEPVDEIPDEYPYPRPTFPRRYTQPSDEKNDCFFKVIDVQIEDKKLEVQGECHSMNKLEEFYRGVPLQRENTIRVILDGRRTSNKGRLHDGDAKDPSFPTCVGTCIQRYNIPGCPLYSSNAEFAEWRLYHLPTLRRLLNRSAEPKWYSAQCFAEHSMDCSLRPVKREQLEPFQLEKSYIHFTVDWTADGNCPKLVCFAPDPLITSNGSVIQNDGADIDRRCANASWILLRQLDRSLSMQQVKLELTDSSTAQVLRLLILSILCAILERNVICMDRISIWYPRLSSTISREAWLSKLGNTTMIKNMTSVFRRIEDTLKNITGAIEHTSASLRKSAPLVDYLDGLQQDCNFYKHQISELKARFGELFDALSYAATARQADSVKQLTLLAAFFLPLSLASGILSMQTRFSELNLLLYDFIGVVMILGTLGILLYSISCYGWTINRLVDFIMEMNYGWKVEETPVLRKFLKFTLFAIWWLALLVFLLVGMFKDVIFGFKVFGFEAAGITGLWLLSLIGVRMTVKRRKEL